MLAKNLTYTNFFGDRVEKTFYFHLSKVDLADMMAGESLLDKVQMLSQNVEGRGAEIILFFRDLLEKAYGERSDDGDAFIKDEARAKAFVQGAAFDALIDDILTGDENPVDFLTAILPADLAKRAKEYADERAGLPQDHKKKAGK